MPTAVGNALKKTFGHLIDYSDIPEHRMPCDCPDHKGLAKATRMYESLKKSRRAK